MLIVRSQRRRSGTRGSVISTRELASVLPMSYATVSRCDNELLAGGYLVQRGTVGSRRVLAVVAERGRRVEFSGLLLREMTEQVRQGVPRAEQLTAFDIWLTIFLTDRRGEWGPGGACGFSRDRIREVIAAYGMTPPDEHTLTESVARLVATGLLRREGGRGRQWILTPMFAPPKRDRLPRVVREQMARARSRARVPRHAAAALAGLSTGGVPDDTAPPPGGVPDETVGGVPDETAAGPPGSDIGSSSQVSASRRDAVRDAPTRTRFYKTSIALDRYDLDNQFISASALDRLPPQMRATFTGKVRVIAI